MNSHSEYNACDVFLMLQTNSILRHGLTCVFCNKIICAPLLNYKSIHSNTWKESIVKNKVWFRVNFNNFRVLQKCTYSDQYTFFLLKRLLCWCTCFQQGKIRCTTETKGNCLTYKDYSNVSNVQLLIFQSNKIIPHLSKIF